MLSGQPANLSTKDARPPVAPETKDGHIDRHKLSERARAEHRIIERPASDGLDHPLMETGGRPLVDEPFGVEDMQQTHVGKGLCERWVGDELPALHVVRKEDGDAVEEE